MKRLAERVFHNIHSSSTPADQEELRAGLRGCLLMIHQPTVGREAQTALGLHSAIAGNFLEAAGMHQQLTSVPLPLVVRVEL